MGKFANGKYSMYFACTAGFILFLINAAGLIPRDCKYQHLNTFSTIHLLFIPIFSLCNIHWNDNNCDQSSNLRVI